MSQYINEAFKQFRLLESEDLDLSPTGLDTLDTYMNQAMSDEDIDIIDLEAEAEEDLKKSYIGKVICDCNVCHSNIFYNKEDIVIDEDGVVNPEDECPYCMSLDGYTIVGEIKPYEEGVTEEEHEDDVDLDVNLEGNEEAEEPLEVESEEDDDEKEDDDLDESLTEAFSEGQRVYIKPNKRFGKIKSHIKNDLYEVETYDGEDKNLPDRVDTYYASDLELNESLPLSGVAKLKGKSTLRRRDEHDGCKCILGRNNTELSGDEDLHESIDDTYNDVMTPEEARKYWDSEKDSDPVLAEFDNFQDWYDESVKNGYIKESITEETDITTVKVDALSNGPEDEEEFKSWLANHYPNLSCEFTDDIYDNLILTGPKQDIKKYLLNDYSYEVEGEDWVVTQYPQLKESITESTEKFEIAPAGQGKWKVLKNSVDGGRVSEDSRIVIDADTKEEAREILLANGFKAEELLESIENVSIDTEDETMTMTTKEDGGVVIETSPKEEFEETFEEEEPTELENGDEMIAPLDLETEDELGITDESEEDDMNFDFGEETPEEDVDIDEFDEETFDGLGESYLRRCYENVNSFKTTNVICNENLLTVEGNIGFKSGNVKKTSFIFEAKESSNGKYVFEGYNNEINIGKKAFRLNCSIDNKKIIPESLNYNYRSKNDLNESVKLHGTVKAPKRG